MNSEQIKLSKLDSAFIQGLLARQREFQRGLEEDFNQFLQRLNKDYEVELGKSHKLNLDSGTLDPNPDQNEDLTPREEIKE